MATCPGSLGLPSGGVDIQHFFVMLGYPSENIETNYIASTSRIGLNHYKMIRVLLIYSSVLGTSLIILII